MTSDYTEHVEGELDILNEYLGFNFENLFNPRRLIYSISAGKTDILRTDFIYLSYLYSFSNNVNIYETTPITIFSNHNQLYFIGDLRKLEDYMKSYVLTSTCYHFSPSFNALLRDHFTRIPSLATLIFELKV